MSFESMDIYSSALRRIIETKSHIYIDVLVVSEFINRYARQKWDIHKQLGSVPGVNHSLRKNIEAQLRRKRKNHS